MDIIHLGIIVCAVGALLGVLMLKLSESAIALLIGLAVGVGGMIAVLKYGNDAIWKNGDVKILSQTTIASADEAEAIATNGYYFVTDDNGATKRCSIENMEIFFSDETNEVLYVEYTKTYGFIKTDTFKNVIVFPESVLDKVKN